jgi:DNA mismatch repair protein MutS2
LEQQARDHAEQARQLREQYEEQLRRLRQQRAELLAQARQEVQRLLQQANSLIEQTLRELREQQRPVADIRREFTRQREELLQALKPDEPEAVVQSEPVELSAGAWVTVEGMSSAGMVVELDRQHGTALVEFNGLKLRIGLDKLRPAAPPKSEPSRSAPSYALWTSATNLDIRGMRVADALREVDRFLAEALQGDALQVRIIHGKGTGALREALHQFLATHPAVAEYRLADLSEGGAGVTIVTLR